MDISLREFRETTAVRRLIIAVFASGVSVVGTSFALYGTSKDFLVISASRVFLDILPGSIVASIIWSFGDYSLAVSLIVFGFFGAIATGTLGCLGYLFGARSVESRQPVAGTVSSFVLVSLAALPVSNGFVPVVVPAIVGAAATVLVLGHWHLADEEPTDRARRSLLKTAAAIGGYNAIAHVVGVFRGHGGGLPDTLDNSDGEPIQQALDDAASKSFDIDGMPGLAVDIGEFYKVDINPRPPVVDESNWSLSVTGKVGTERTFDYESIQERETINEFQTLRCLGDPVDGKQIGNALWTGTPLLDLVDEANPNGSHLVLRAADDYYYSMPIEMAEGALLAYGMNGETLPRAHGFPVRALVRSRWGKLNVKWIEEIEVVDEFASGYWEERGWDGMDTVNTVVKLQATNRLSNGAVQIGGHAYAGARGIQEVEVSIDGGETWDTATLADPLEDPDTWRQWKYEWQPERSSYDISLRATDGTGETQTRIRTDPYPAGATGWTRRELDVQL